MVQIARCPLCKSVMVAPTKTDGLFPYGLYSGFDEQLALARWKKKVYVGDSGDHEYICSDCVAAGKATFTCALCEKAQPTTQLHKSWGFRPSESMCKTCYETVPAKVWDAKSDELFEKHRYDFE